MANITLSVPEEMFLEMKKHKEMKWSEVAREAIARKLAELKAVNKILSKSRITEKDAEEIGHRIKHEIRKRPSDETHSGY